MGKGQINATNATLYLLRQAIWGHIWKRTVEKSQINAANVTMHLLMQEVWGHIWKHTVEKSPTNVTSVTLHALIQDLWEGIWKATVEECRPHFLCTTNFAPLVETAGSCLKWVKTFQFILEMGEMRLMMESLCSHFDEDEDCRKSKLLLCKNSLFSPDYQFFSFPFSPWPSWLP